MGKIINFTEWIDNNNKKQEYICKINEYVKSLNKHRTKYNRINDKKLVLFKNNRLAKLEKLIQSDKHGIVVYTRLYCGNADSLDEVLKTSTVI